MWWPWKKKDSKQEFRERLNKQFMSLECALWLAIDRMPIDNIDSAAKRLAHEVWLLQDELGRKQTIGDWKK